MVLDVFSVFLIGMPKHLNFARIAFQQAGKYIHRGCLSSTIWAQETVYFSSLNSQAKAGKHLLVQTWIGLREIFNM
jgi:hypothetical protein